MGHMSTTNFLVGRLSCGKSNKFCTTGQYWMMISSQHSKAAALHLLLELQHKLLMQWGHSVRTTTLQLDYLVDIENPKSTHKIHQNRSDLTSHVTIACR